LIVDCSTAELLAADGSDISVRLRRFSRVFEAAAAADGEAASDLLDELFLRGAPLSSDDRFLTAFGSALRCPGSAADRRF
jgi:hypothetical protein